IMHGTAAERNQNQTIDRNGALEKLHYAP
ncbi:MAG: hypothetical protein QOI73_2277, partial [Solirubrobacteraceae bacterium]|nr:hypothetical protein [Solirubrobacteraceae bacterium]